MAFKLGNSTFSCTFCTPLPLTPLGTPYNYCSSSRIGPRDGSLDSRGDGEKLATPQPDLATLLQKTGNTVIF